MGVVMDPEGVSSPLVLGRPTALFRASESHYRGR
jgi:hypothetical protein